MKWLFVFLISLFSVQAVYSQEELIELAQLLLGIEGVESDEDVYHTIGAVGTVWEKSGSNYIISTDGDIYNSTNYSTGNFSSGGSLTRAQFNWTWKGEQEGFAPWGLGFYKITNSKVAGKYFYLDTRDNEYVDNAPYNNPDVWFVYDVDEEKYFCVVKCDNESIENGEIVKVSDVLGHTFKTDKLQNYWSHTLLVLTDGNNPQLVWGPHPTFDADSFKVYRAASLNPLPHPEVYASVIATVSSSTYEYVDNQISLSTNGEYLYYFIKAYNGSYSGASNVRLVRGVFYKESIYSNYNSQIKFSLNQNYPNPFNLTTIIKYQIPEDGFVTLKVYDILGKEITTLIKEQKTAGEYEVEFDAADLAGGVYIYRITALKDDKILFSQAKEMILLK